MLSYEVNGCVSEIMDLVDFFYSQFLACITEFSCILLHDRFFEKGRGGSDRYRAPELVQVLCTGVASSNNFVPGTQVSNCIITYVELLHRAVSLWNKKKKDCGVKVQVLVLVLVL